MLSGFRDQSHCNRHRHYRCSAEFRRYATWVAWAYKRHQCPQVAERGLRASAVLRHQLSDNAAGYGDLRGTSRVIRLSRKEKKMIAMI